MKILMLAKGSWIHSRRPLKWLLDSGLEVIFVDQEHPGVEEFDQLKYVPYPVARATRLYSWLEKQTYDRIAQWTVELQLRWIRWKSKADVVHLHWIDKRAYQVVGAKLRPLVLSVLGSDINRFFVSETSSEDRQRVGGVLKNADIVLVDSEDMIEKCQQLAEGQANVKLFPVGIDTKKFSLDYEEEVADWKRKLNIPSDAIILFSVRALNPIYNHHVILDAFSRAIQLVARPVYLIMKDYNNYLPVYKKELQEHIQKLGIETNIRWIQDLIPDSEMPVLYKLSDLIINFPAYDAFPVTFVESAASSRPVISCRLPAYENTFAEKYFRMLDANTADELCNTLIEYVNGTWTPNASNIAAVREYVQENFAEDVTLQNLLNIYRELADGK